MSNSGAKAPAMPTLGYINVFAEDIVSLARFYREVFGFTEIAAFATPIFRAVDVGTLTLGFSAKSAYELLGLDEYSDPIGTRMILTFEAQAKGDVATLTERAVANGARLIKPPYDTYYGAHQSVLADPESNVFRINKLAV